MVTGTEIEAVWSLVGKCGAAVAVLVALIKGVQYLFELTPTHKLAERVSAVEEHDKKDLERLDKIESRLDSLEEKYNLTLMQIDEISEGIQRIGKSQISLLHHFANGNGQNEMRKEADELTSYFIERK